MKRSNVLFILSDEHQHAAMGCAGHLWAYTPHLDALAARGTRFANAYSPSPICVPARASLATGRYVHQHGCWDNAMAYDGTPPGWAHRLSEAGVSVEAIGKLHYRDAQAPTGFRRQHSPVHIMDGIGQVWGSVRDPLPDTMGPSPLYREVGAGYSDYNRFDENVATQACDWLARHQEDATPWALFVGFVAPHFPLVVPQRYLDRYPPEALPLPRLHPSRGYVRHPWVERQARFMDHDQSLGDDDRRRLAIAAYLGLVTFLDEQVGRILHALREHGLDTSTTVVYTSDHGDNLGARGMWNKCLMYRESTGVPMILAGPDIPTNEVRQTPVSLVDVQATLLDCANVRDVTPGVGTSLARLARQPDDPNRQVFSEYHAVGAESAAYMLADARYKYHYYVGFPPELFDLRNDPDEVHNLAPLPEYQGLLHEFEQKLRSMLDPEAVDIRAKADQAALVRRHGGRDTALRRGPPAATPIPSA